MKKIVSILLSILLLLSVVGFSGCSSSSGKSYAEQYGYSVNDFYRKGSDGKWYPR